LGSVVVVFWNFALTTFKPRFWLGVVYGGSEKRSVEKRENVAD
jgi:hypothetical protein